MSYAGMLRRAGADVSLAVTTTGMSKYRCPACGFPIFNRRVARCESCAADLPPELLLSAEEVARLYWGNVSKRCWQHVAEAVAVAGSTCGDRALCGIWSSRGDDWCDHEPDLRDALLIIAQNQCSRSSQCAPTV